MPIAITPLHPHIGAEVSGIDVSQPLANTALDELWAAIDRHCVVVLHNQSITDAQLKGFAGRFGPLEIGRGALQPGRRRLDIPEIGDISNLDVDNNIRARDDRRAVVPALAVWTLARRQRTVTRWANGTRKNRARARRPG